MFLDFLREVTQIDVSISQLAPSVDTASDPSAVISVFPLQALSIDVVVTLKIDVADVPQHPTMRHIAMEYGVSDPLAAWNELMSQLHMTPVLLTKTSAPANSGNGSNVRSSSTLARLGGLADDAFVLDVYPPAGKNAAAAAAASPARRRRSTIGRFTDGVNSAPPTESYVSLAWPENPLAEAARPPLRTSFSPPGGALARNPGASFFHACPSLLLEGVRTGYVPPTRSASPAPVDSSGIAATPAAHQVVEQQPQFTFTLPITIPNVANGSGCIAIRLNLSPAPPAKQHVSHNAALPPVPLSVGATPGDAAYDALVDYDTIDAPMSHLDVSPPSLHSSIDVAGGTTLGRAASLGGSAATSDGGEDQRNNDPLFLGTAVQPIRVRAGLECETRSRLVAPNRTHILVSLTNVTSLNTQIESVEFDLLSTRIGQFKDSLDYAANKSPDYRTAPKAPEDNLVATLSRSISVVPLATDEGKPYLQPRETYCFQFVVQLRPHLAHLLTRHAASSVVENATKADSGTMRGSIVDAAANGSVAATTKAAATRELQELLKETFVSAVHVQFRADAAALGTDRLFRAELSVPWALS